MGARHSSTGHDRPRRYDAPFDTCIREGIHTAVRRQRHRRNRRIISVAVTLTVLCAIGLVGVHMAGLEGAKTRQLMECETMTQTLMDKAQRAYELSEKAHSTFVTLDERYDLDTLGELIERQPPTVPRTDCSTGPQAAMRTMERAIGEFDTYNRTLQTALTPKEGTTTND